MHQISSDGKAMGAAFPVHTPPCHDTGSEGGETPMILQERKERAYIQDRKLHSLVYFSALNSLVVSLCASTRNSSSIPQALMKGLMVELLQSSRSKSLGLSRRECWFSPTILPFRLRSFSETMSRCRKSSDPRSLRVFLMVLRAKGRIAEVSI